MPASERVIQGHINLKIRLLEEAEKKENQAEPPDLYARAAILDVLIARMGPMFSGCPLIPSIDDITAEAGRGYSLNGNLSKGKVRYELGNILAERELVMSNVKGYYPKGSERRVLPRY